MGMRQQKGAKPTDVMVEALPVLPFQLPGALEEAGIDPEPGPSGVEHMVRARHNSRRSLELDFGKRT
jgi:hypothetical protein